MRGAGWICGLAMSMALVGGWRTAMAQTAVPGSVGRSSDQEVAKGFLPLLDKCGAAVNERGEPSEQTSACRAAARAADAFAANTRTIERRTAYVYCATALMRSQELKEAVACGDKAVKVVLEGQDDNGGSAAAYGVRAQAQALRGYFAEADKDLMMAENFQRAAARSSAPGVAKDKNLEALRALLNLHAKVLIALGRASEGRAKTMEAATL